jgi:ribosomal protein S18 acetylase RimI-like enzyme
MPITRISAGVLKTPEFAHLQKNQRTWTRLKLHLKDETLRCYASVNDAGVPLAYAVCSFTEGTSSLLCTYFEELHPYGLTRKFLLDLLDYTGFEVLRMPAPSEPVADILKGFGFLLVEEMWEGDVRPYREFPIVPEIHSVSGDAFYKLTQKEVERLHELIWQATVDEIETDVLSRRLSQLIPSGMDEVLNRTGDYHYEVFVYRDSEQSNRIVGFAYCHKLEPGYVAVGGLGVCRNEQGKYIGRKLAAAVLRHAAQMTDKIYATVFSNNLASRHLFTEVLKFKPVMSVYGLTRNDVEPPKKGKDSGGGKIAAEIRRKQAMDLLQDNE